MNICICDDDKSFCDELYSKIYHLLTFNDYGDIDFSINVFYDSKNLVEHLADRSIDILFLDISMPEIDGFDIAKLCYEQFQETKIIFVSDYEERVYYSLRFNPFRFLCKKNYVNNLSEALNSAILTHLKSQNQLMIKTDNKYISIRISKIAFAEKEKETNYLILHCGKNTYRFRANVTDFLSLVAMHPFVKINSGCVVNMEHISSVENGYVILSDGAKLGISRRQKCDVKTAYIKYMREV